MSGAKRAGRGARERYEGLQHLTVNQAADALGVSGSAVVQAASRLGLTFSREKAGRDKYEKLAHLSVLQAAAVLGMDANSVINAGYRYGVKFAPEPPRDLPFDMDEMERQLFRLLPDYDAVEVARMLDHGADIITALAVLADRREVAGVLPGAGRAAQGSGA